MTNLAVDAAGRAVGQTAGGWLGGLAGGLIGPEGIPIGAAVGRFAGGYAGAAGADWLYTHMANANNKAGAQPDAKTNTKTCDSCKSSTKNNSESQKKFKTQDEAAKKALEEANGKSIEDNKEYGGVIYKNPDGTYGYTGPTAGNGDSFDPSSAPAPDGTTTVGDYHTHGDYSIEGSNGEPVATGDPAQDDYNSDNFSPADKQGIKQDAAGNPGYKGYLGTPSGQMKVFDPVTGKVSKM